ncbi:26084_t:CDS:2 [Dentiscutata erythropus]|uniref:26084_t:CDS:1 n=1 Tax=Dentiscutata erythropus TaxID=1348616 RepID=A0A9N9IUD6_9GLOM|nr:26084_t:CDS:2 [Dentiscutata erythropus]
MTLLSNKKIAKAKFVNLLIPKYENLKNESATLIYVAIHHTTFHIQTCKALTAFIIAFTIFYRLVIAGISLITYFRQKICDTGKCDWKLFLPSALIASLLAVSASQTYGSGVYWCAAVPNTIMIPLFSIVVTLLVLAICLFCYAHTIRTIRVIKNQQSIFDESQCTSKYSLNDIEVKVSIKILGYVLVYMIQWIPAISYDIYQYYGNARPWVYCMVMISFNMGPIGNTIFFIINEGNCSYNKSSSPPTYDNVRSGSANSNNNSFAISAENKSLEADHIY